MKSSQPHLIIPELSIPKGHRFHHEGIGKNQPLAAEVIQPLLRLGLEVGVLSQRSTHRTNWKRPRNFHLFCIVIKGKILFQHNDGEKALRPRELMFCPAHQLHGFSISEETCFVYFEFSEEDCWKSLKKRGLHIRSYESADLLYLLVRRISDAYQKRDLMALSFASEDARFLANLLKREVELAEKKPPKQQNRIQNLVDSICQEPSSEWSLEKLAREAKVSTNTLSRIFIKSYGLTPMELVIRERMINAGKLLMNSDDKVSSIARQLGYESLSSFSRLFKKHMGRRPGEYRKQMREV